MRWLSIVAFCLSSIFFGRHLIGQECIAYQCQPPAQSANSYSKCFPGLCDPPGCNSRNWVDIDYIQFFSDGFRAPALVTGSDAGTARPDVGILGDPATNVLFGNDRIGSSSLSGLRIGFGHYLDDCGNTAITGSLFALGNDSSSTFPRDPTSIISRPFFNTDPAVNGPDAELVNFPGVVNGSITVSNDTDIYSGGIGIQKKVCCCSDGCSAQRTDVFLGYRAFGLDDSLVISESLTSDVSSGFVPTGTTFDVIDRFETENRFHGVEFGVMRTWQRQRWTFEAGSRVALGNINQRVLIDGSTTVTVPGVEPVVQPFGILAGPSNIGEYERNRFGVLTDSQLEIGYWLSCRLKLQLGYNFIFINDVARPGNAIDLNVNGTAIDPTVATSGAASPNFDWNSESLFLHGFNAGIEFRF